MKEKGPVSLFSPWWSKATLLKPHKPPYTPVCQGRLQGGREPAAYLQNCPGGSLAAPGRPGCHCTAGLLLLLALSMPSRTRPFSAYPNTGVVLVSIRFPGQVASLRNRHQIESPKRPPKKSAQGRLMQSINVEIRTELEKRVLYAL
jgi:hypothetical protein